MSLKLTDPHPAKLTLPLKIGQTFRINNSPLKSILVVVQSHLQVITKFILKCLLTNNLFPNREIVQVTVSQIYTTTHLTQRNKAIANQAAKPVLV